MKLKRSDSTRTKLLPDGHVVLINNESEWAYTITPLVGIAWEFCDGTQSLDEIVKSVSEVASVDQQTIRAELEDVLSKLTSAGLIEISS